MSTSHKICSRRLATALSLAVFLAAAPASRAADPASEPARRKKENVRLTIAGWDDVQRLVASHRGKVVVLDIWTTTCPICLEEFPKFAALQDEFGEQIACISVNCDYDGIKTKPPKFYRDKVLKFLRKHGATFDNILLDVAFIDFLEQQKLGSTPAVMVYGPNGKLARRFDNSEARRAEDEFTIDDVRKLIARLLPE